MKRIHIDSPEFWSNPDTSEAELHKIVAAEIRHLPDTSGGGFCFQLIARVTTPSPRTMKLVRHTTTHSGFKTETEALKAAQFEATRFAAAHRKSTHTHNPIRRLLRRPPTAK